MEPRCKSTVRRHHFLSYFVNLSRCCGGVYYSLEHCFRSLRFVGICVCIALLKWHHISVKVKSGLWLRHWNTWILFFFRRSAVVLGIIILFGTGFSCWTDGLRSDSRILWYIEVNSMSARCPGPVTAKQAQILTSPPLCLTVGMGCFFKHGAVYYRPTSPLWSRLFKGRCKVLWFVQLFKPELCCHVIFRE